MSKYLKKISIKGFQEVSLLDWDGKIASILFLPGCNFRCPFCHSPSLVTGHNELEDIPFEIIQEYLKKRRDWVDAVVITGGEPTIHEDIFELIYALKALSYSVKLDSNGTNPEALREIIKQRLIDYFAIDIKAPFTNGCSQYNKAAGVNVDIESIAESVKLVISSGIDHEFRTTAVPGIIGRSQIMEIARSLNGAKKYCIQQFVTRETLDPSYLNIKPYQKEELERLALLAGEHLNNVKVRFN